MCRNPFLAEQRARKREQLLAATEKQLEVIAAATRRERRALRGKEKIGMRVGKVINRHKVAKHFAVETSDRGFSYRRKQEKISAEAALDGLYVIRTSVSAEQFSAEQAVGAYKDLSKVEQAFRCLKTVDLKVRPIYHHLERRVRAHVFLCMLAYYVEWHMRKRLKPLLFAEEDPSGAEALRPSVVAPADRSASARAKDSTRRSAEGGYPLQSFHGLLSHLATLTRNRVQAGGETAFEFTQLSIATALQQRAFELLEVKP